MEMVEGVRRASAVSMVGSLVGEVVCRAGATGHLNNIIKEIIDQGQDIRNIVGRRLRNDRLKEEQIMKMMIADVAREERLEDRARKIAARLERFYRMEVDEMTTKMGMLSVMDWEESMEVDVLTRDVTLDLDGDTIMTYQSGRK